MLSAVILRRNEMFTNTADHKLCCPNNRSILQMVMVNDGLTERTEFNSLKKEYAQ